jgi:hypothetical protein
VPTFVIKWLAPILIVLALVGGGYLKGKADADRSAEISQLTDAFLDMKTKRDIEMAARVADANLAKEQGKKLRELKAQAQSIQEYADALEDAGRECLSGADNDRLRDLWK